MNDYDIKLLAEFIKIEEKVKKVCDKFSFYSVNIDKLLEDINNVKQDIKEF